MEGIKLSPEQRFFHTIHPQHREGHVNQVCLPLPAGADAEALGAILRDVVSRTEILRTSIVVVSGLREPLQIVSRDARAEIETHDTGSDGCARDGVLSDIRARIDPSKAGWRVDILRTPELTELAATAHPLILDLASLLQIVDVLLNRSTLSDDPESLQFADISDWQNEILDDETGAHEWRQWLADFKNCPDPDIGIPHSGKVCSATAATRTVRIGREAFADFADGAGTSPLSACRAAWATMLARCGNVSGVRLTIRTEGRHHEDLAAMPGPLERQVPCVLHVDGNADLARQAETLDRQLNERQALIDHLPVAAAARAGTQSSLFGFAGLDSGTFHPTGITGPSVNAGVALRAVATATDVLLTVLYDPLVCPGSFASLMLERVSFCLGRWLDAPSTSADALPLLSEAERQLVADGLTGSGLTAPDATVMDDILRHVSDHGSRGALRCGDTQLTYAEVGQRAAAIAAALRKLGVQHGNVVICGGRSAGFVVAILGVSSAGFTYVPVDSSYPEERVRFIVEDADAVCVICDATYDGHANGKLPVLRFDEQGLLTGPDVAGTGVAGNSARPSGTAYLIYTSGSTGKPKGVTITHTNLQLSTHARKVEYDRQPGTYLMPSSFAFDSSVAGIFWTLVSGGTLVLPRPGEEADAQALAKLISTHRVTHTLMLPSLYEAVLRTCAPGDLATLQTVIVAGEECSPGVAAKHFATIPDAGLFNEYGPTEATVWCTVYRITPNDAGSRLPIGRPIAGTTLHILDAGANPVPMGAAGELYVANASVATGYWQRKDLTAERFVEEPLPATKGRRMYRTGDLVRLNAAGQIEFLGRVDRQVKIRGYRIELEEVENAMRRIPGIASAAVTVRDSAGSKELAGYYTAGEADFDESRLIAALAESLPGHFVPKTFIRLAAMPLMPNGKIDFNALPASAEPVNKGDAGYEEPRNDRERALQKIFEETLERDRIGIRDGFFETGGHSILATIAVARMREKFGMPIAIRILFDHPTIAELHDALFGEAGDGHLRTPAAEAGEPAQTAVAKRADSATGRLSPMQSALWYLSELDSGRGAYNLQCGFRLNGSLDRQALQQALNLVVNSHAALRSEIAAGADGQPYARIHQLVEVPFEFADLRGSDRQVREFLEQAAVQPVATNRAPLLRVNLARTGDDEYLLVFVFHHIVVEGWSVATLLQETGRAYAGLAAGDTVQLQPEPIDYWDWNEYEAGRLGTDALAPQLTYWKRQLAGKAPHLELAHHSVGRAARGGMAGRSLSGDLVQRLEGVAKAQSATLFMVLLAAYQVLLHRYTGESDIRVGVPINTRTRAELDRTAGLFINTLVIRGQATPPLAFTDFLATLKNDVLDAFSNMDAPLEAVARAVDESRGKANRDLFQVMFALQNAPSMSLALPGVRSTMLEHDELHSGAGKVDLSLVIEPGDGDYRAWAEFDGRAFDRERAERFLRHFDTLLHSIAEAPGGQIGNLGILPSEERKILLDDFNATECRYDERVAARRLWEQVGKQPDAVAVSSPGESLTYHELGLEAAKAVRAILAADCPAGGAIAICMRRSPTLVAALAGSHLAGCCYVPIDPEYPDERIEYIVRDSGAAMLITDTPERFGALALRAAIVDSSSIYAMTPAAVDSFRWPSNDDLAYIVYTSGSTGVPKGVRIAQRGLSNLVSWEEKTYGLTPQDRGTMLAGLGFDATVWEVWPCLAVGAALYQIDDDIRANPAAVYAWLAQHDITVTFLPTPLAEVVLDLPPPERIALRYLFTGGDVLHARQWPQLPFPVVNHYGPSENTVIATAGVVPLDLPSDVPPNIGKPIDNTRAYILDNALQLVPVGIVGELCLAGPAVSLGYVNQDERSADRFVPNPYGRGHWGRMYRTGDQAYYNADGTIEFLGRMDQQVKVRGFRIELGDIEATLGSHPAVANAAVTVWNVNRDDQRLSAYVVPAQEHAVVDPVTLRKYLRKRLPSYMVPTYFTTVGALPLTSNGKVDREALPLPAGDEKARIEEPPATPAEIAIADIWRKILAAEAVDRNANFFEIGGNSILAMKFVSEVTLRLGVQVPLRAVVMDTLSQIAAYCDQESRSEVPEKSDGGLQKLFARVFGS